MTAAKRFAAVFPALSICAATLLWTDARLPRTARAANQRAQQQSDRTSQDAAAAVPSDTAESEAATASPTARLLRGEWTARLTGYSAQPDGELPAGEERARELGLNVPTLVGTANIAIQTPSKDQGVCSLGAMDLAVSEPRWDNSQRPAKMGNQEDGSLVVLVAPGSNLLQLNWSRQGMTTPDGCEFRFQLPPAAVQHLTLIVPDGLVPVVAGTVAEGPKPDAQQGWQRWSIPLASHRESQLRLYRPAATPASGEVLVSQTTTYRLDETGVHWTASFDIRALGRPADTLEFAVDPGIEIHEVSLSLIGSELFPGLVLHGTMSADDRFVVQLPEPLRGATRIVLQGSAPLVTRRRWRLPGVRMAKATWQQESAELHVSAPLVVTALDVVDGRQTNWEATVPGTGQRLAFQFYEPGGRITLQLDVEGPELRCRYAGHVLWSPEGVALSTHSDWSTVNGEVFVLRFAIAQGWIVDDVQIQSQTRDGRWSSEPELLREWSISQNDQQHILRMVLTQAVTAQRVLRSVITSHREGLTAGKLDAQELYEFEPIGAERRGVYALTAPVPFRIETDHMPLELLVPDPSEEADDWHQRFTHLPSGLMLRPDRHRRPIELQLVPERSRFDATVAVYTAVLSDGVLQNIELQCDPREEAPLARVLVYFSDGTLGPFTWRLQRRISAGEDRRPALQSRRLRPEVHAQWGLPERGALWEIQLSKPFPRRVIIVAQAFQPGGVDCSVPLPILPEASRRQGFVRLGAHDPARVHVDQQGLTRLAGPSSQLPDMTGEPADLGDFTSDAQSPVVHPVGWWTYEGFESRLRLAVSPRNDGEKTSATPRGTMCVHATLEAKAQPNGPTECRVTYWLLPNESPRVKVQLPSYCQLLGATINGRELGSSEVRSRSTDSGRHGDSPRDAVAARSRTSIPGGQFDLPFEKGPPLQTLMLWYRIETPGPGDAKHWWSARLVSQVTLPLPAIGVPITLLHSSLLLPENYDAVIFPETLVQHGRTTYRSWLHRLFGPLLRREEVRPFNPWSERDWDALLRGPILNFSDSRAAPRSADAIGMLFLPEDPWSAVPGWQRLEWTSTVPAPELTLTIAQKPSMVLIACAAWLLGVMAASLIGSTMRSNRSILLPVLVVSAWSLALVVPEPASTMSAAFAVGVLTAAAWAYWHMRQQPQPPDTSSGSTVSKLLIAGSLMLACVSPAGIRPPPAKASYESDSSRSAAPQKDARAVDAVSASPVSRPSQSVATDAQEQSIGDTVQPSQFNGSRYTIVEAAYNGGIVHGHLQLTSQFKVVVNHATPSSPTRVRFPFQSENVGLKENPVCLRDGNAIPFLPLISGEDGMDVLISQPGSYSIEFAMAPLWATSSPATVQRWESAIPPLPQSRLQLKVPAGEGDVSVQNARGLVEQTKTENGETINASLGAVSQLVVERRTARSDRRVEVDEALVLDLVPRPILRVWFRYHVSGGTVRYLYWSLDAGMRAPRVKSQGRELSAQLLPSGPDDVPIAAIDLGEERAGEFVLEADFPLDWPQGRAAIGKLRVPRVFSLSAKRRTALLAIGSRGSTKVEVLESSETPIEAQIPLAQLVRNWGIEELDRIAQQAGPAFPWVGDAGVLRLALRPAPLNVRAKQTLELEPHDDYLAIRLAIQVTSDEVGGFQHRLQIPSDMELEEIRVDAPTAILRGWKRSETDATRLTLFFNESPAAAHTVVLAGFVPGNPSEKQLPHFEFEGAQLDASSIVLYALQGKKAELIQRKAIESVPLPAGIPVRSASGGRLQQVYTVNGSKPEAVLRLLDEDSASNASAASPARKAGAGATAPIEASLPAETADNAKPEPSIFLSHVALHLGENGQYLGEVTYFTNSLPPTGLTFRLPPQSTLISTGAAAGLVDLRAGEERWNSVMTVAPHLPEIVTVRWQGVQHWPATVGDVDLPSVELKSGIVDRTVWTVHWPARVQPAAPIRGALKIGQETQLAAELDAILQQARAIIDRNPPLPNRFVRKRLRELLSVMAHLRAGRRNSPRIVERFADAAAIEKQYALNVDWDGLARQSHAILAPLGLTASVPEFTQTHNVTYAVTAPSGRTSTLGVHVMAVSWLRTIQHVVAVAIVWLAGGCWIVGSRRRWFGVPEAARPIILLSAIGLAWWLWLSPSAIGLLLVVASPALAWRIRRRHTRGSRSQIVIDPL